MEDVVARATASSSKTGVPDDARLIFTEGISSSLDYYARHLAFDKKGSPEALSHLEGLAQLWCAYAAMEISFRQFKKAIDVFDEALKEPLLQQSASIFIAYAHFYWFDRKKFVKAQNMLLRGLEAMSVETSANQRSVDRLWVEFLSMKRNDPDMDEEEKAGLTCTSLYELVLEEGEWVSNLLPVPLVLPKVGSNCVHAFPIVRDAVVVVVVN